MQSVMRGIFTGVLLFAVLAAASCASERTVGGAVRSTRIVPDHASETKWGSELTWRAEYQVIYSVGGREYSVWADSGIRRESEDSVQLALPKSSISCRVQYHPNTPETATAVCH